MADWGTGFGKQMLMVVLSVIVISLFFSYAIRKQSLVPSRVQFFAEACYGFARNTLGREILGEKHFMAWVPFLFTVFFFVLVNNLFGAIPALQLPSFSHAGAAYAMAAIVWFTWVGVGVKLHGLRYFKLATVPSGVPGWLLPLLVPIEILSNFIIRPITHSLRLMAVMLAGHIIVMLAGSGAEFLIVQQESLGMNATGVLVLFGFIPLYFLELIMMVLQAFVFALLTAIYIQGAIEADAH
ncbi:F0F1 ATP synthase subunit A [Nesterenkonia sp. LY-0111]|uniref:ATP synthase subunit a n=2 Tax=Nesterenkonia aerolata TaxID=3074079 RepID=A0ABU2DT22_9MICC|nr:F0F1 ATP synthase subunit A [Nesterenkonia sp. LY-0111]MDR8019515.1 F0F1 ATP synthase subunit A [Nesterenkonia sp. LY-0111]